jgi:murein DD-endopeptidase MepM/ murein hydrolase activator NlpD
MPKAQRSPIALVLTLVLALVLALVVAPAGADPRTEREQARARKAQAAKDLNTLKASDAVLAQAVADLDAHITTQSAQVEGARQAVQAAEAQLADAQHRLELTEARIVQLRRAVVNRAVEAYIRPSQNSIDELVSSEDVTEATLKQTLLDQVTGNDQAALEELRAAQEDYAAEKEAAAAAAAAAAARRDEAEARLRELQGSRAEKARLKSALDARIAEIQHEVEGLSAQEGRLSQIISAAERASAGSAAPAGARSGSGLIWPARGTVTSEYGNRWGRLHAGIDIANATGTPIWAAKSGTVIQAGTMSGYGNVVIIDHGGGFTTLYGHQSRIAVRNGQSVTQGSVIGYIGSTGHSTGPHLHFETRVNGSPQNPRRYLP